MIERFKVRLSVPASFVYVFVVFRDVVMDPPPVYRFIRQSEPYLIRLCDFVTGCVRQGVESGYGTPLNADGLNEIMRIQVQRGDIDPPRSSPSESVNRDGMHVIEGRIDHYVNENAAGGNDDRIRLPHDRQSSISSPHIHENVMDWTGSPHELYHDYVDGLPNFEPQGDPVHNEPTTLRQLSPETTQMTLEDSPGNIRRSARLRALRLRLATIQAPTQAVNQQVGSGNNRSPAPVRHGRIPTRRTQSTSPDLRTGSPPTRRSPRTPATTPRRRRIAPNSPIHLNVHTPRAPTYDGRDAMTTPMRTTTVPTTHIPFDAPTAANPPPTSMSSSSAAAPYTRPVYDSPLDQPEFYDFGVTRVLVIEIQTSITELDPENIRTTASFEPFDGVNPSDKLEVVARGPRSFHARIRVPMPN